jgi:hypothetical protein
LKDNFKIEQSDSSKEIRQKVQQGWLQIEPNADRTDNVTIPYLLELFSVENGFDALKDLDPEIKRRKTFEILKNLSLKGAQVRPLVIAIEDLHWIDKTSEESLNILLENIPGARVLLIFTFRSNYLPPWGGKTSRIMLWSTIGWAAPWVTWGGTMRPVIIFSTPWNYPNNPEALKLKGRFMIIWANWIIFRVFSKAH